MNHLKPACPGLHGPDSRMSVEEMPIGTLLKTFETFEIPIMQRKYCWDSTLWHGWWTSLTSSGLNSINGGHRTGKVILYRRKDSPGSIMVIDGQQRLTTSMLLLASLRDALFKKFEVTKEATLAEMGRKLHRLIFNPSLSGLSSEDLLRVTNQLKDGDLLPGSRLVPSFPDRQTFFQLIAPSGLTLIQADKKDGYLCGARAYFDKMSLPLGGNDLLRYSFAALNHMEVFQWLQENALVSMGALLYNPNPGVKFEARDLVRNLFISNYIQLPFAEVEGLYKTYWLPLERANPTDKSFETFLERFISLKEAVQPQSNPSVMEETLISFDALVKAKGIKMDLRGAILYSRFTRIYLVLMEGLKDLPETQRPIEILKEMSRV